MDPTQLKHWLDNLGDYVEDKEGPPCAVKDGTFDPKTREFDAIASSNRVDRDTEIVEPSAFAEHLDEFKANPVMLFAHNPFGTPIGMWPKINLEKNQIPVRGKLRPEGDDELADNVARAIEGKFLRTVSIGFRIFAIEPPEFDDEGKIKRPARITKAALYEISVVNVPANVDAAIRMAKALASDGGLPEAVVKTVFAPAPSDAAVLKRAAAILRRVGQEQASGADHDAELLAGVKELREHVVTLSAGEQVDFGRLRALRELTEDLRRLRGSTVPE